MMYLMGALTAVSALETWLLYRVFARVGAIGRLDDRVSSLTHTIALLTDTTETCFNAVAAQIEAAPAKPVKARAARQGRVIGAASKGRTVGEIAAEEQLAESEVSLRLHMARPRAPREERKRGALRA